MFECMCSGGSGGSVSVSILQAGLGVCQGNTSVTLLLLSCVLELFCFHDHTKIR